ncbi:MAG TPA: DoxX family protein [Terracidiphilus sp.]|nr:DoxX family protein [Terracidiphilus sp.]
MRARIGLYWISTALIALETFVGGIMDLTRGRTAVFSGPRVSDVLTGLGYPLYVLVIIGVYKIPGAIALILPGFERLKEWAYAGIVFELSAAAASQAFCGNAGEVIAPTILLGLALVSSASRPRRRDRNRLGQVEFRT